MKKSYLFLAEGFEETEALAVVDILRRGKVEVEIVSISSQPDVKGAHGISVKADTLLKDVACTEAECLIFPGGMPGAQHLAENRELIEWLQRHFEAGAWVAAICAAPALVLGQLRTSRPLQLTCYPGFEKYLSRATVSTEGVVVDGNVVTGKGPGYAMAFGLKVLEKLTSAENAKQVAAGMLL